MSFVYKNITNFPQLIAVVNESRSDVSHVPLAPGAKIELSEPVLDMYMPHILARLNEAGADITHTVLRYNEQQKDVKVSKKEAQQVVNDELPPAEDAKVSDPAADAVVKSEEKEATVKGKVKKG